MLEIHPLAFLILCAVVYALMGFIVYNLGRLSCILETVVEGWANREKVSEQDLKDAWNCYQTSDDMHLLIGVMSVFWPIGLALMIVSHALHIPYSVYKRCVSGRFTLSFKNVTLRPAWWNWSKLTSILNRFI